MSNFLEFAHELAQASGEIIRRYFRAPVDVETKADLTPVTIADREAERAMRRLIQARYPDDGILGEEFEPVNPGAARQWVLDPIDGTKTFVAGAPLFGTLIALIEAGKPVLGAIHNPILEQFLIGDGHAAWLNGAPARVRQCTAIEQATLLVTDPLNVHKARDGEAFEALARRAESIHDDLYARAAALSDGQTTLVLCALDLVGFFQHDAAEVIGRVRQAHPRAQIVIAATHTHHGPDTMGLWGPDDKTRGVDALYLAELKDQIVGAILESLNLASEGAAVKMAGVRLPGVAKNARDPEIVDDELTVLQFLSQDQRPLLTLFDFPCHPEVLWEHNPHISSDYPGFLRRAVEAETGAPCIFFSGALGGMMTPDVQEHSFAEAEAMGIALAQAGLGALQKAENVNLAEQALNLTRREFNAKLQNPLFKIAIRRGLLPEPRDARGRVTAEVNLIQIGAAWFLTAPGELLPKLGLAIKRKLRQAGAGVAGVIGLANDELGYILPKEDYRYPLNPLHPGSHYEETMSISKEIGPRLMAAVEALLGACVEFAQPR
jgi:histidinol phosphatase-like enzyme (inositol monophosphatase family)